MQAMTNAWLKDVASWMSEVNLEEYWDLIDQGRHQAAHHFANRRFTTYCFHICGCRFLLEKFIELPIVRSNSVARPASSTIATVEDLLGEFMRHKETDE